MANSEKWWKWRETKQKALIKTFKYCNILSTFCISKVSKSLDAGRLSVLDFQFIVRDSFRCLYPRVCVVLISYLMQLVYFLKIHLWWAFDTMVKMLPQLSESPIRMTRFRCQLSFQFQFSANVYPGKVGDDSWIYMAACDLHGRCRLSSVILTLVLSIPGCSRHLRFELVDKKFLSLLSFCLSLALPFKQASNN